MQLLEHAARLAKQDSSRTLFHHALRVVEARMVATHGYRPGARPSIDRSAMADGMGRGSQCCG
jgi:hypothetical protein